MIGGGFAPLIATVIATAPLTSRSQRPNPDPPVMDIAPLEADIVAMQRTLRRLEDIVDARAPHRIGELISPRASDPQRRGIELAVASFVAGLPSETRFYMRTDVGRGAIVPIGAERVQIQVSSTREKAGARRTGRVDLELEAVETQGRREWLLVSLVFPGQRPLVVGGLPTGLLVAIGCVVSVPVVTVVVVWILRRRRSRRNERASTG